MIRRPFTLQRLDSIIWTLSVSCFISVKFSEFAEHLSETIGAHHLPLNRNPRKGEDIVHADAIHYNLARQIFGRIYKENGCTNLSDPVLLGSVLDALGKVNLEFYESEQSDAEGHQLLNDIGEASVSLLNDQA